MKPPARPAVRAATTADIPVIQAIARATWPVSYARMISPAQIAYMLDLMYGTAALEEQFGTQGHRFLLAEQDGRPVGFAGFEHGHRGLPHTRLHKLYVLPQVQRSGTGLALLQAVLAEALRAGDTAVELNVNRHNPARDFYARHGFTIARDEVIDIGGGFVMDDHVMVRPVRPT